MKKILTKRHILSLISAFVLLVSQSKALEASGLKIELKQVRGLEFYYRISPWLGDQLADYFKNKILAEAHGFQWSPVTKLIARSSPNMFFDKAKLTRSSTTGVEFWGLEESSTEISEKGQVMPKPSVAYRYHFECAQPSESQLLYAIKFSGPTGTGAIEQIDTHFNGQWRRGSSNLIDQSLSNFKPLFAEACDKEPS